MSWADNGELVGWLPIDGMNSVAEEKKEPIQSLLLQRANGERSKIDKILLFESHYGSWLVGLVSVLMLPTVIRKEKERRGEERRGDRYSLIASIDANLFRNGGSFCFFSSLLIFCHQDITICCFPKPLAAAAHFWLLFHAKRAVSHHVAFLSISVSVSVAASQSATE